MSEPKIYYTLIAYDRTILVDYYEKKGDLVDHMRNKIFKVTKEQGNKVINSENIDFIYTKELDKIVVLSAIDSNFNKEVAFQYLDGLRESLKENYDLQSLSRIKKDGLQNFRETIAQVTKTFNEKWVDKSKLALEKVIQTRKLVQVNLDDLLKREEQLSEVEDKGIIIAQNSEHLMKNANTLRKKTQREYYKMLCIIISVAIFALYILLAFICGFTFQNCFQIIFNIY